MDQKDNYAATDENDALNQDTRTLKIIHTQAKWHHTNDKHDTHHNLGYTAPHPPAHTHTHTHTAPDLARVLALLGAAWVNVLTLPPPPT